MSNSFSGENLGNWLKMVNWMPNDTMHLFLMKKFHHPFILCNGSKTLPYMNRCRENHNIEQSVLVSLQRLRELLTFLRIFIPYSIVFLFTIDISRLKKLHNKILLSQPRLIFVSPWSYSITSPYNHCPTQSTNITGHKPLL